MAEIQTDQKFIFERGTKSTPVNVLLDRLGIEMLPDTCELRKTG